MSTIEKVLLNNQTIEDPVSCENEVAVPDNCEICDKEVFSSLDYKFHKK